MNRPLPELPKSCEGKLVHAEMLFSSQPLPPTELPEFTLEELLSLGVVYSENDELRMVEVSFLAQKKLTEAAKQFGFGANNALTKIQHRMLALCGFEGTYEVAADPATFTWTAFQKRPHTSASPVVDDSQLQLPLT